MKSKLTIGTAQFGLNYGIANSGGQVSLEEISRILDYAKGQGIKTLDTAIAYGDSESRLGQVGVKGWNVISKLPPVPEGCLNVRDWIFTSIEESLKRLGISRLKGLLFHKPDDLNLAHGNVVYEALVDLISQKMVEKIGISIYSLAELNLADQFEQLKIVQTPFNLIDRRFETHFESLKKKNVEVHVRSIFLQGLLLMDIESRPVKFDRWKELWKKYDAFVQSSGATRLEVCLNFAQSFPAIDNIIVGIDNLKQLKGICFASEQHLTMYPESMRNEDEALINPALWATL